MAEARERAEWQRTASLMALAVNLVRNPKKSKPAKPADFNPYFRKVSPITKVPLEILRDAFIKEKEK